VAAASTLCGSHFHHGNRARDRLRRRGEHHDQNTVVVSRVGSGRVNGLCEIKVSDQTLRYFCWQQSVDVAPLKLRLTAVTPIIRRQAEAGKKFGLQEVGNLGDLPDRLVNGQHVKPEGLICFPSVDHGSGDENCAGL
jgi:hypothetical protein